MKFTDDDLKRLKEYIGKGELYQFLDDEHEGNEIDESEDNYVSINALLARLDAAEELAQEAMCHCKYDCDECGKMKTAWQKSKGVSK